MNAHTPKQIEDSDTFPLWSFGYREVPTNDKPNKIMTSRGRTQQEAWTCIQTISGSFKEPSKVSLLAVVAIEHKNDYDKTHPYNWLRDAPMWLKQQTGQIDLVW